MQYLARTLSPQHRFLSQWQHNAHFLTGHVFQTNWWLSEALFRSSLASLWPSQQRRGRQGGRESSGVGIMSSNQHINWSSAAYDLDFWLVTSSHLPWVYFITHSMLTANAVIPFSTSTLNSALLSYAAISKFMHAVPKRQVGESGVTKFPVWPKLSSLHSILSLFQGSQQLHFKVMDLKVYSYGT